jgi:hypothetical protein
VEEIDPNESKLIPKFEILFKLNVFKIGLIDNMINQQGMAVELNNLDAHLLVYDGLNYHNVNSIELGLKL